MSAKATNQYLQRYAETEINYLDSWPAKYRYQQVLLIPAYKEKAVFLHRALHASWFSTDTLLILIINQPANDHDLSPQQALYDTALRCSKTLWHQGNLTLLEPNAATSQQACGHLLIVDRFQRPIPEKQGVGLARKIGADLALALIHQRMIKNAWIGSTDADASLPDDYFTATQDVPHDAVAACYDFTHVAGTDSNPNIITATQTYEQAMRYYVAGLHYAGSPYAYFTIGSILTFKASAYAQARGFPKRAAGEDFYLLNKLVKLGAIAQLKATIRLEARLSDRVPFGTGVSTAKIMQLENEGKPFCYYHPQVFDELRRVLLHFRQLRKHGASTGQWLQALPPASRQALSQLGLRETIEKLQRQCCNKQQFNRQLNGWFDALKTLRFIHLLRDTAYPNLPLEQAVRQTTHEKRLPRTKLRHSK